MSGVKGKSGRKPKTLTRERAIQSLTQKLPKAIQTISDTMEGTISDRLRYEAAIQIKDSVMGKPIAQVALSGGEKIGSGLVIELYKLLADRQRELYLLKEGDNVKQGAEEGTGEVEETETA